MTAGSEAAALVRKRIVHDSTFATRLTAYIHTFKSKPVALESHTWQIHIGLYGISHMLKIMLTKYCDFNGLQCCLYCGK